MHKDFLQDTNFRQSDEHDGSQSELAARAWTNRLGDSPVEFYQMVSVEGQAAIRKGLQDELTKLHDEQQKMMAERENLKRAEQWREAKLDREVTESEKQYANELAKRAWKNITDMASPLAHELTPRAEALKVQEFDEEVEKIRAEDERDFTADQKKEILENPSEIMKEAYRESVHDRACRVFEGRQHEFDDFKPEYRDQLLTHWQEEMISLRDKDRGAEQSKDQAEREGGSGIEPTRTDTSKADDVTVGIREGVVKESNDVTYEHFVDLDENSLDRTAFSEIKSDEAARGGIDEAILGGSGVEVRSDFVNELKGVKEIQESVSKWWNREYSKTPFGPEMQVIDYPRAPGSEWNVEDYDREFDLYFEFEHGPDAMASVQERGSGTSTAEHDINRLLFEDGQSFDQINRPFGLDSHDDRENSKEDSLEFERSDWSEHGR